MAHTNETQYYKLPQFVGTDKPSWLTDINNAFVDIDNAIHEVAGNEGSEYQLPVASALTLGGVKIGNGLNIDEDGTLSVDGDGSGYNLPVASNTTLGGIKTSKTITVNENGEASVPNADYDTNGLVRVGDNLIVDGNGNLSVPTASPEVSGVIKQGLNLNVETDGTMNVVLIQGIPTEGAVEGQLYYEVEA